MPNTLLHSPLPPTRAQGRADHDRRLLFFVGRHGAVSIAHVMAALDVGQSAAYDRVAALIGAGLLGRLALLRGEPALLRATRAGLRYVGLGMAPAVVSPGSVGHWLRCASVALQLEARHGAHRVLTARELIFAERHEARPIASAKLGELPNGRPRLHRPDLVVLPEDHPLIGERSLHLQAPRPPADPRTRKRGSEESGVDERRLVRAEEIRADEGPAAHPRTREGEREIASCDERALSGAEEMRAYVNDARTSGGAEDVRADQVPAAHARTREQAREISGDHQRAPEGAEDMGVCVYEVELTPKSPKTLREIIRGWRRASWVDEIVYLCEPGQTRRAVERAVQKLHAADRIQIREVPR